MVSSLKMHLDGVKRILDNLASEATNLNHVKAVLVIAYAAEQEVINSVDLAH